MRNNTLLLVVVILLAVASYVVTGEVVSFGFLVLAGIFFFLDSEGRGFLMALLMLVASAVFSIVWLLIALLF